MACDGTLLNSVVKIEIVFKFKKLVICSFLVSTRKRMDLMRPFLGR